MLNLNYLKKTPLFCNIFEGDQKNNKNDLKFN